MKILDQHVTQDDSCESAKYISMKHWKSLPRSLAVSHNTMAMGKSGHWVHMLFMQTDHVMGEIRKANGSSDKNTEHYHKSMDARFSCKSDGLQGLPLKEKFQTSSGRPFVVGRVGSRGSTVLDVFA